MQTSHEHIQGKKCTVKHHVQQISFQKYLYIFQPKRRKNYSIFYSNNLHIYYNCHHNSYKWKREKLPSIITPFFKLKLRRIQTLFILIIQGFNVTNLPHTIPLLPTLPTALFVP